MHVVRLWHRTSPFLLQVLPRMAQKEPQVWLSPGFTLFCLLSVWLRLRFFPNIVRWVAYEVMASHSHATVSIMRDDSPAREFYLVTHGKSSMLSLSKANKPVKSRVLAP